ncbi:MULTISPECIES: curli-like amyloid fiber formation chaperone CsgH [Phyllobacteriaceae]|jgi:hypothetical protein|uniref:CsgH-like domain-containing protein n=1 Tax=Mesorhizobium hungaricum TaxID=1566387 RepID=A0A1C2DZ58_9HYPH|nr:MULTISPECIES: curli-like amyloid fiber formation chaperone CsgH [Mesorhizobium]MBN9234641.1 hypothetical protein [Mesorhizobium sp.]MDQ0328879.1 hypothetical protein [Mesorhizobium sp. YL-MeA3-2017]OCX19923.1 hypothetical protein QV13_09995 [Mesorhizobium hungaricum]
MANTDRRIPTVAAIAFAGLVAVGASGAFADKDNSASGPLRCEIRGRVQGNTIFIEPVVRSDEGVSGSYSITVSGGGAGGSSNIRQGGEFTALPGHPTALGQISLSAADASYDVKLKVAAAGTSATCTKQVPSEI